ncbi:MAG: hypothetical protein MUE36_09290 [Acidimicrobiales bacterium]|nr:hypothetical protein [Acidimicrobiales bacterium]
MAGPGVEAGRRRGRAIGAIGLVVAMLVVAACSGPSDESGSDATAGATVPTVARPDGPVADLSEQITGPGEPFVAEATEPDLTGYVQEEFVAAGTATDYAAPDGLPGDGVWSFVPDTTAPYRTRIVVRRPADPAEASGTVLVEWLNVSGGADANPDWVVLAEEITRRGHTWVGVSAQRSGVEGGPVLVSTPGAEGITGKGLKALDPARYATLDHPGDGYSFDIYTQVARALRDGGAPTGGVTPDVVLAVGESQSAVALTTYHNGVQPLTRAFDGFFVHSRAFVALPLAEPGASVDLAGSLGVPDPVLLRSDLEAPVMVLQAEGDVTSVLGSVAVRQPDTDTYRLWEVAGGAHADTRLVGDRADSLGCAVPINDSATHVVAKAALRGLEHWVRTGEPPPAAPRLEVTDAPDIVRDADGIAVGGVRTPVVDVPVDVLSGESAPDASLLCLLMGSTLPLPPERIAELHPSRADYERRFAEATDRGIDAGFVLPEDRALLLDYAQPERVG